MFDDVAPKVIAGWRARAAVESPSHLRDHAQPTRLALLSALLFERQREITDTLVELLIATIHRINARAEKKVVEEFVKDFRRVTGKDTLLRHIAEASLDAPDGRVRDVIYRSSAGRRRCEPWWPSTGPAATNTRPTSAGSSRPPTRTTTGGA